MSYNCKGGLFWLWSTAVPQHKCLIIFPLGVTHEWVKKTLVECLRRSLRDQNRTIQVRVLFFFFFRFEKFKMKVKSNRQSFTASLTERRDKLWWRAVWVSSTEVTYMNLLRSWTFLIYIISLIHHRRAPEMTRAGTPKLPRRRRNFSQENGDRAPEKRPAPQCSSAVMTACQKPKWEQAKCSEESVFIRDVFRAEEEDFHRSKWIPHNQTESLGLMESQSKAKVSIISIVTIKSARISSMLCSRQACDARSRTHM